MQADNGKMRGRSATPETTTHGTAQAKRAQSPAGTTASGTTAARRRARSGPPSKSSVPVSIRVPIELANALRSIAVQTNVGHPFAAVFAPDPDDTLSLPPLAKDIVLWSFAQMVLCRIWLNVRMIEADQVPDHLRGNLVTKVPDELQELRRLHPAIDRAFSEFLRVPSDNDRVVASLKTGSIDPEVVERALTGGAQQPRDEPDPPSAPGERT